MSLVNFRAKNHPQQVSKCGACEHTDDRETPPEIFDPLHAEHRFTWDVAASIENKKTANFMSIHGCGLTTPWPLGESIWCNPPYSNIGAWVEKAWRAMLLERAGRVVMLLPANRTEQKWWQAHVEPWRDGVSRNGVSLTVHFLPGRPRFFRPSGKLGGPRGDRPPFGCCVLTWMRA